MREYALIVKYRMAGNDLFVALVAGKTAKEALSKWVEDHPKTEPLAITAGGVAQGTGVRLDKIGVESVIRPFESVTQID